MYANAPDTGPRAAAGCCFTDERLWSEDDGKTWTPCPRLKLAEIHFQMGRWRLETVAHELTHLWIETIRSELAPPLSEMLEQDPHAAEECGCYRFGRWVDAVARWLDRHDPE